MKKSGSIVVTTALIATVLFGGGGSAMATDQAPARAGVSVTSRVVPDAQIIKAEGNHVEVLVSGELVVIDYFDGGAIISDANGQKTRIEAGAADGLTAQAIAAVVALGPGAPAGAIVLATMYALGVDAFLVWVGAQC